METPAHTGEPAEPILLFVVGAHLSGEPLNHQLTLLGGRLVARGRTSEQYRLYALPGTPARPGMVRTLGPSGAAIEGEIWTLTPVAFGRFVSHVSPPLTIGKVEIETGELVSGFLCEAYATIGCADITAYGGWRRYLQATQERSAS